MCQLVLFVEHYHVDGSSWFWENYTWEAEEGLKHKRKTNSRGRILMDNGKVAPLREHDLPALRYAYLPEGREWARHDTIHMDESSVFNTIRSIHVQRLITGWPNGTVDRLSPVSEARLRRGRDGCDQLLAKFKYLEGVSL